MDEPSNDHDDDRDNRSRSRSPQSQRTNSDQESGTAARFHLGGLGSKRISEKDLEDYFGKMVAAEMTDLVVKRHKGFGYIEFEKISSYEESKILGSHDINGRTIQCKRAKPREQTQKQSSDAKQQEGQGSNNESAAENEDKIESRPRFFIGGINSTFTKRCMVEYFQRFGHIVDVLLLFHKGFGYIEFAMMSEEDEEKIIGTHHIKGRDLEVKKAKAKPKGQLTVLKNLPTSPLPPVPPMPAMPAPPVHQAVFDAPHHQERDPQGTHMKQDVTSPRYFVGGITDEVSHSDMREYFSKFGELIDVTIIFNKSIGYIQFRKSSATVETQREHKLLHQKHHINDQVLNCSRANPKNMPHDVSFPKPYHPAPRPNYHHHHEPDGNQMDHNSAGTVSPRRFFLGGINANTTRANLMDYFTKYGDVINLMIFEEKNFGYIEFKKTTPEDDVQRESVLIGEIGRSLHTINGVAVTCKRAIPRSAKSHHQSSQPPFQQPFQPNPVQQPMEPPPIQEQNDDFKYKMFVGGLGLLKEVQLREYFSKFGEIHTVLLLRGFGFITFKSPGTVDQAIQDGKVINGKTMHCICGKYVECKRTVNKKSRPPGQNPGQSTQGSWNHFNPEAPPFTPNSMQQNPSQPQQYPQGGYGFPQGQQGGAYPGQMPAAQQQGYGWNNYGMMPQQSYDMNNPGVMGQQGYDMNNTAMMGQQQGYSNISMMGQQGYGWNNASVPQSQYVGWTGYMPQQNYDWNSGIAIPPGQMSYYAGQPIQFPDFVTGESSMNTSEQGSKSVDNDNSSGSTPTQDSQQTASSNADERTEEISDNTSSISVQSVFSKYATGNQPQATQTKTVQSVLSKYSLVPTVEGDYSSEEQQLDAGSQETTSYSSENDATQYGHNYVQNVNGSGEEEEEEWFEGDLE